jgi:predicted DNA-binding transcriptional regulator AlpA
MIIAMKSNYAAQPNLLRLRDVARMVSMSEGRVRQLSRTAYFPSPVRIGLRALRWRRDAVLQWLAERPAA